MSRSMIGVGSPLLDILSGVEDSFLQKNIPGAKGGMVNCDAAEVRRISALLPARKTAPGGAAGNTVFGLAHLGMKSAMLGKTGNDEYGSFYRDRLAKLGGDTSAFAFDPETATGCCVSMITPDNERTMRTDLGAAARLTPEDVEKVDFSRYSVVYIEGYMLFNRPVMQTLLKNAKAAGCEIALDLASFEVVNLFRDQLNSYIDNDLDMVFANEDEAAALLGKMPEETMAERLAERCRISVVKIGKRGSLIGSGHDLFRIAPDLAPDAVDSTGAGDLWTTGFFYGYLNGRPLDECGRFGSVTAREVVRVVGADIPEDRWEIVRREFGLQF